VNSAHDHRVFDSPIPSKRSDPLDLHYR